MKKIYLYGYNDKLPEFKDLCQIEQVKLLKRMKIDGVFGGYHDPAFVDMMHENDMRVFASIGCFVGGGWWKKLPDTIPIKANGQPFEKFGGYCGLNPANDKLRQAKLKELELLLDESDMDGVWLDYIRWPYNWESLEPIDYESSFDEHTKSLFMSYIGSDKELKNEEILTTYHIRWKQFRYDTITSWVKDARKILNEKKKILGIFTVAPIGSFDMDKTGEIVGQDIESLSRYADVLSPMVYHSICKKEPEWIAETSLETIRRAQGRAEIMPIIQSVDSKEKFDKTQYISALKTADNIEGIDAVIVFNFVGHLKKLGLCAIDI